MDSPGNDRSSVSEPSRLRTAHVLFVDIVGYSLLATDEQIRSVQQLQSIVRELPGFREALAAGELICIPTGDGMAIVCFSEADAPVRFARDMAIRIRRESPFGLRMGLHYGPVYCSDDINASRNVAGGGINLAQRIMDCGDAGHVLLSQSVADTLLQLSHWRGAVRDLGECEVKHGLRLRIFNLSTAEFGNPAIPSKLLQAGKDSSLERMASIAVLPFANMSPDAGDEYFSDGLSEEILNLLAKIPGLRVIARTSAFAFKGRNTDVRRIAETLGVRTILEGSVRRAGSHIRVTTQLINAADGCHLWSERYDRELTDMFAVQDEIAAATAEVLRVKLLPETAASRRYVPNLRAHDVYLKARDLWFSGTRLELLGRFKELLERAIELDPKFALAYSFLGMYYTMQANLGFKLAREVIPSAVAAEEEALRVDPSLPEAQALLAVCMGGFDFDWSKAERHWRLAMTPEPVSGDVLFWYGNHHLLPVGRTADAIGAMERGLHGDPLNLLYRHHYARGLRLAGRMADAEAELRTILAMDDNYPHALVTLGSICAQQQRNDEALVLTEKAHALMPWSSLIAGLLAGILVRTGGVSRADALIGKLKLTPEAPVGSVVFHALCGEMDQAAQWAERAIEQRDMQFVQNLGPFLRPTTSWPTLAKMMNLPV